MFVEKIIKKIMKKNKKDFEERKDAFLKEYRLLVDKYKIDIAVKLKYDNFSITPELFLVDLKDIKNDNAEQSK
jgi:hypothetical protein